MLIDLSVGIEAYSEFCQSSGVECFVKIVDSFQTLTIFVNAPVLDVSEHTSEIFPNIDHILNFA